MTVKGLANICRKEENNEGIVNVVVVVVVVVVLGLEVEILFFTEPLKISHIKYILAGKRRNHDK